MGRPAKNKTPRTKKLTLMLSDDELLLIRHCAEEMGISRTDVIMEAINRLKKTII